MLEEKDYKSTPFDGSYEEFKDEQVISFVKKYVMAMKNNKRIPPSVFDFLKRTVKKNAIEPDEAPVLIGWIIWKTVCKWQTIIPIIEPKPK